MKNYEVKHMMTSQGGHAGGRHICTGCEQPFEKGDLLEIANVRLANELVTVVNVHANDECRLAASRIVS